MDKGNESFVDVWGIDVDKYNADTEGQVEEVITEVKAGSDADVDKVQQDEVSGDEQDDAKPSSEPVVVEDQGVEGDEKQAEGSAEGEEDASSKTPAEPAAAEDVSEYEGLMQDLVEDDLLYFDEEKEYDIKTDKGLKEMIADTVAKKSKDAVTAFKDGLGSDASKLMGVLEKGGSVEDFVKMDQQIDFANVPLEDKNGGQYENNQEHLIRDWMKVQEYAQDDIEEQVRDFHENGMLRKQAEFAQKKLAIHQKKQDADLLSSREKEQVAATELAETTAVEFKETVTKTRDLAGFNVTEKKAKKLYDFITQKGKDGKTSFEKVDTEENKLLYAYFAMEGFNKEKLSKEVATKQARTFKRKIENFKDTNASPSRSGGTVKRENQDTPNIPWIS